MVWTPGSEGGGGAEALVSWVLGLKLSLVLIILPVSRPVSRVTHLTQRWARFSEA